MHTATFENALVWTHGPKTVVFPLPLPLPLPSSCNFLRNLLLISLRSFLSGKGLSSFFAVALLYEACIHEVKTTKRSESTGNKFEKHGGRICSWLSKTFSGHFFRADPA